MTPPATQTAKDSKTTAKPPTNGVNGTKDEKDVATTAATTDTGVAQRRKSSKFSLPANAM